MSPTFSICEPFWFAQEIRLNDTHTNGLDKLLTQARAAELLNVKPRTLENYRARRVGPPFIAISRRCVRYRLADLEAWIASKAIAEEVR